MVVEHNGTRMKILIAYDGSSCADAALEDLQRAGLPRWVEATVLTVAEELLPVLESAGTGEGRIVAALPLSLDRAVSVAEEGRLLLQSYFPDWEVTADAQPGSAASVIIERAEQMRAHLVVVGSHSRSALGRVVLGSVSQKVVSAARCSVRIARRGEAEIGAPLRIFIGVDGSPDAAAAVAEVAARNWPPDSEACVAMALDEVTSGVIEYAGRDWMHETIEAAGEVLRASGLSVSSLIRKGSPQHVLPTEAEAWAADAIFVGARGSSRFQRFRLGSVSAATAARAHCSVEVVRCRA